MGWRIAVPVCGFAVMLAGSTRAQQIIHHYDGTMQNHQIGTSVAGMGDSDGDGVPDFLIGCTGDPMGTAQFTGSLTHYSGASGAQLHFYHGTAAFEFVGQACSGAGDLDNDGFADFLIGGYKFSSNKGMARAYSGATGALLHAHVGAAAGDLLGWSVSATGDLNLDGFDDYAVASLEEKNAGPPVVTQAGAVRVHSGFDGSLLRVVRGTATAASFGYSVSGVGDIDGDGSSDLLVGAPTDSTVQASAGRAFVFSGFDGSKIVTLNGTNPNDYLGRSVASGGDYDGDGRSDMLVGSSGAFGGAFESGLATLFVGGTAPVAALTIAGKNTGDGCGARVCFADDVDHDGVIDVAVSSPGALDPTLNKRGSVVLASGASGLPIYVAYGKSTIATGAYGLALDSAGDVDGDGFFDLIVGDKQATPPSGLTLAGMVDVISGRCGRFVPYGANCASPTSSPHLYAYGCSSGGNTVTLGYDHGPSSSLAILFVGSAPASIPMSGGCTLLVQLTPISFTLPLGTHGAVEVPIALPSALPPVVLYLQGFSPDPSATAGFVASNGLEFAIE